MEKQFFLGTSLPMLRVADKLDNLDIFWSDSSIDYSDSSARHVTFTAPRILTPGTYLDEVRVLVASTTPQEVEMYDFEIWGQRIVCLIRGTEWLKELHREILAVKGFPTSGSEWEGDNYNTHTMIAKSARPSEYIDVVRGYFELPIKWTPRSIDVHVKTPETKIFFPRGDFMPFNV